MKREITLSELKNLNNTLQVYYDHIKKEQQALKEAFVLDEKIMDEREVAGIKFDAESGTYNNTDTPYINQLILEKTSCEKVAADCKKVYISIDKCYSIKRKLKDLTSNQKIALYSVYKKNMSKKKIAEELCITVQAVDDRLENALIRILEVD